MDHFPKGSVIRRVNIEPAIMFGAGRALLLQLAHPAVAQGVDEHSDFKGNPFKRLQGTLEATYAVVFEAVGVPGMIDSVLRSAPHGSRIVVVGVCMEQDRINPFFGISKELNIQFVLGYDPMEFADTLRAIAEGQIDVAPMITAEVDLDGVPAAFDALANPDEHCKILVTP